SYQISHLTRFPHFRPSATLVNTRNHFRRKISTQTAPLISIKFSMDSSSNLSPLAEESSGDELRSHKGLEDETPKPPVSAFASVPDRPASQLSFALSAAQIKEKARVVAMDMRGHGKTATENDLDLSIETMCKDVLAVVTAMFGNSPPAIILVGHSMGGSVAVHVAAKKLIPQLAGLVVVDVVEGTAMASLAHMQKILSSRMQHFPSIEKAIEWNVKGGSLRNIDSARVSIPTTLKYDDARRCYVYRAQLVETEQYWRGWYEGLSEKFLSCPVPKLLLLAGTDRLDRVLTIGQMQGKFQMVVVRHTGHAIQEDVPDEFAALIVNFISRNRIGPNGVEVGAVAVLVGCSNLPSYEFFSFCRYLDFVGRCSHKINVPVVETCTNFYVPSG
ncbi:Protein phosphatase methylesterase 1, partial [Linum perenne]